MGAITNRHRYTDVLAGNHVGRGRDEEQHEFRHVIGLDADFH
jgi:ribosomal protein L27